jgi:diaminohydroxyphosphoribosylaminopyrimidine deaminase/5-amino-6-(5-phosphoribosylamino)uracil reductase
LLGSGHSAIGDLGAESIGDLRRFNLADVSRLGNDVRLTLTPLTETPLTDQGTV